MGIDVAVAVVRECLPMEVLVSSARMALPSTDMVILLSDESGLPAFARAALGTSTVASLWTTIESPEVFRSFVMFLSQHSSPGAVGITLADHACVSAFLFAQGGKVVEEGDKDEEYLALLPAAVEQAFEIDLGLTQDDILFFTERLLLDPTGFKLEADGGPPVQLSKDEVKAVLEADGAFADYECALGL